MERLIQWNLQCCKHPLVVLAILFVPVVYAGQAAWFVVGVEAALAFGLMFVSSETTSRLLIILTVATLIGAGWLLRSAHWSAENFNRPPGQVVAGLGTVVVQGRQTRTGDSPFTLQLEAWASEGLVRLDSQHVTVWGRKGASPDVGSQWHWRGHWSKGGTLLWQEGRQTGWSAPWWQWRAELRESWNQALAAWGPGPAALAEALLIGDADGLTPWEQSAFRNAGCSHVLALSGMHLGLLAVVLFASLRRWTRPGFRFVVIQSALTLFCFIAGPLPSLWRAWVMAALAGWWKWRRLPIPVSEVLAQSFVVTVWLWPEMASTLSLQLSFLAMSGLIWGAKPCERALRPWLGTFTAGQIGSSTAAWFATLPLVLADFGEAHWVGILYTPPLVLLTSIELYMSALGLIVHFILPSVPLVLFRPVAQFLYDAIFSVAASAALIPPLRGGILLAGLVSLGGIAFFLYKRIRRSVSMPVSLNYDSPTALQSFLDSRGFNALKRWGQNFLINAGARRQILKALDLTPGEPVWEIGPGLGALTHEIVSESRPLTVFEIDPGYVEFLADEFGDRPGFRVVEGDMIKTWKRVAEDTGLPKVVGNLPYNAASAIVAEFVESGWLPSCFVVTVQLEMAQRMTASPGTKNYSSFSILCQSAFTLDDVVTLKPGSFYPAPEVTSRVVRLRPHNRYPGLNAQRFALLVRECFSSRRKTLRNNLPGAAAALKVSDEDLGRAFAICGIDLGLRAEALPVETFVAVYRALDSRQGSI